MMKNSIYKRLLISVLLISTFFFLALGFLDYYLARNTIIDLSESKAMVSVSDASAEIDSYLMQKAQYAYIIAQDEQMRVFVKNLNTRYQDLSGDENYQQLLTTFKRIVTQDSDISEAYIAITKTGRIYDSMEYDNPPEYQVKFRPWYINALKSKTLTFTAPYICPVTGKYVITASIPFYDNNGSLLGVAAVDILADKVQNIVNSVRFCDSGYAYMFDDSGNIIFHHQEKYIGKSLFNEKYFSADISENARSAIEGQESFSKVSIDGQEKYMFYAPVKGVNWSIAITVPSNEIIEPVNFLGKSSFVTIVIGIIFLAFILNWWTSRFTKSIKDFTLLMSKIEDGDYTLRAEANDSDEIGLLGKSVNRMLDKQENILEKTTDISYKIGLAGHDLAMTIGAINTLVPIISEELNNNFFKKYHSTETIDKFSGLIGVMQDFIERILLFDHDSRLFSTQLINTEAKINKLSIKEDAASTIYFQEFKAQWDEMNKQMTKTYNSVSKLNIDFVLLLEDLNSIYFNLSSETDSMQEIRDKIENINNVQIESIKNAQARSLELLSHSQSLLELSSNYKTSNDD